MPSKFHYSSLRSLDTILRLKITTATHAEEEHMW